MKRKGYTITEMMVVMAIIVATAAFATIKGKDLISYGKYSAAKAGASALALAASHYYYEIGSYPTALTNLTSKTSDKGPWIETDALTDPWNLSYRYAYDTTNRKFAVWSCGANGTSESSVSSIGGDDAGVIGH